MRVWGATLARPPWRRSYYRRLLPELVTSWRALFDVEFSALVVQLAAYGGVEGPPEARSGSALPALRDTQLSVAGLPAGGVAVAIDIGDQKVIPIEYPACSWTTGEPRWGPPSSGDPHLSTLPPTGTPQGSTRGTRLRWAGAWPCASRPSRAGSPRPAPAAPRPSPLTTQPRA